MRRTTRLVLLTAFAGLVAPVAASQTAVSAIDQDLVLSTASGAAGTEVEVTSASCEATDDADTFRYLWVRLVSGTGPTAVLAGVGSDVEGGAPVLVVPDWVDADQPATIEASCVEVTIDLDSEEFEPTVTRTPYDPVAFDITASPDAPVQQRTYSRTELQLGQAFSVEATGCFLDDAEYAYVDVVPGDDLTLGTLSGAGISGDGPMEGDGFEAIAVMSNGGVSIRVAGDDSGVTDVDIQEHPTDLPEGTYTSISYCGSDDGKLLLFEPQLVEVTGRGPIDEMALTVPAESRQVTLAGTSCTAGDITGYLWAEDLEGVFDEFGDAARTTARSRIGSPAALAVGAASTDPAYRSSGSSFGRLRPHGRTVTENGRDVDLTPAADGSWSLTDDVTFDQGIVGADAYCGDPLADGFIYDGRAAEVAVSPVETTTSTVPTTTPAPAPADAVSGTPTYAG